MEVLERVLSEARQNHYNGFDLAIQMTDSERRRFEPPGQKRLLKKDRKTIETLNIVGHDSISLCICDPDLYDCPIVFASDGFCNFTGYDYSEIEGKSCRFLQGPDTSQSDVDDIRRAIRFEIDSYVSLLNYRKDGTPFRNHFFMSPIHDKHGKLLYFIGVQCFPEKLGDRDDDNAPENMGWGYTSSRIASAVRLAADAKVPDTISRRSSTGSSKMQLLHPGDRAVTYDMVSELNGKKCTVVCYMESTGRYLLELDGNGQTLSLRKSNLKKLQGEETESSYSGSSVDTGETKSSSPPSTPFDDSPMPLKTIYSVETADQMKIPPATSVRAPEVPMLQQQNTTLVEQLQTLQTSSSHQRNNLVDRPDPPAPRIDA